MGGMAWQERAERLVSWTEVGMEGLWGLAQDLGRDPQPETERSRWFIRLD